MGGTDPMMRMLRRVVLGLAVGFALVAFGVFLLSVAVQGEPSGTADGEGATTGALTLVLGWVALAAGPALGLRIGGMPWRRALWAAPVLPLVVLLLDLAG